jgi:hypothetical protein
VGVVGEARAVARSRGPAREPLDAAGVELRGALGPGSPPASGLELRHEVDEQRGRQQREPRREEAGPEAQPGHGQCGEKRAEPGVADGVELRGERGGGAPARGQPLGVHGGGVGL